ncbi:Wall-associated receptor kinase galacturonan-binding domain-containing protein, partial [Cynara cardunculus var. scolymus]
MKLFQLYHLLVCLSLIITPIAPQKYSKPGCLDTCGKVKIPYPFGIGANCSINNWYVVDCNSSKPYLPALNHLEVLLVNLYNHIVTVYAPMIYDFQNQVQNRSQVSSINLGTSPFLFSQLQNKFVLKGCGNALMIDHGIVVAGCSTSCTNDSSVSERNNCFGIMCCQTEIPHYLQSYSLERQGGDVARGSAFLVDKKSYDEGSFFGQSIGVENPYVPISLLWTLTESVLSCCDKIGSPYKFTVDMHNGTSVHSSACAVGNRYEGSPYLPFGCKLNKVCASCKDDEYCEPNINYDGDGFNFTCIEVEGYKFQSKSSQLGVILGNPY